MMRTAIIGGGIAGLAAAYELEKARRAGAEVQYILFESSVRLGGVLSSERVADVVLEHGPDSFLTEKPAAAELCRELGLAHELMPSNDAARKTYILLRNKLIALPDGLMFLIPTKLMPTALSPLFSVGTKLRMALELLHPPRASEEDESVAAMVERHFGTEMVDRLADPLLAGIYGGDARHLSARTVLPKMVEMESLYGSMTRGMLAAHKAMRKRAAAQMQNAQTGVKRAPRGTFTTLKGGLQQLVDALEQQIDARSVRLSTPVTGLERDSAGWRVNSEGRSEEFDSVLLAMPAWAAGALLRPVDEELGLELSSIPYSSSITVNLVFDANALGELPAGFGFLVPAAENRSLLACTFVHRKFARDVQGKIVLRAFLGGMRNEKLIKETNEALVAIVRRELTEILGEHVMRPSAEPVLVHVARWKRSMAQYAVGHQERVERILDCADRLPGLKLAGNAYDGIGISDCVRLGRQAARELVEDEAGQAQPEEQSSARIEA